MTVVTLTAVEYAELLRTRDVVQGPVAIGGYLYAVVRGVDDVNIYRVQV